MVNLLLLLVVRVSLSANVLVIYYSDGQKWVAENGALLQLYSICVALQPECLCMVSDTQCSQL